MGAAANLISYSNIIALFERSLMFSPTAVLKFGLFTSTRGLFLAGHVLLLFDQFGKSDVSN